MPKTLEAGKINHLKQFGITLAENRRLQTLGIAERERELTQQLASYTKEVLEDSPVSTPYSFWFGDDNHLYTHPSQEAVYKVENQIDPQERGGKFLAGFNKLTNQLRQNPDRLIFWYSPPGPASFDQDPDNRYSDIKYNYGQLYIQYFDRKAGKVNAVAVKVTNENAVSQFMPETFQAAGTTTMETRVNYFLTNPQLSNYTIDSFLDQDWDDQTMYRDKEGAPHSLSNIRLQIRNALLGVKPQFSLSTEIKYALKGDVTEKMILDAYLMAIKKHMHVTGQTEMSLSGSCGGAKVEAEGIEAQLGISNLPQVKDVLSLYSSTNRLLNNDGKDYLNDPNLCRCSQGGGKGHFHCPGSKKDTNGSKEPCKHPIIVGKGIKSCPSCGHGATCK